MRETIVVDTKQAQELVDLTAQVREIVARCVKTGGVREGLVHVFTQHSSAAVMLQENWDDSVQKDVVTLLNRLIPAGGWQHDQVDGNGDAHLKAGIVGPSETIPLIDGELALGRWQNVFFCEFDGPRQGRRVVVTVLGS